MPTTINGTTGVSLVANNATINTPNISSPSITGTVSGSSTITSPTLTGATITVASTAAPAFSAYQSSAQTLSAATLTKINLQTEEFDTASCFDSTTNYRFTPTVAGYYQVNGNLAFLTDTSSTNTVAYIYRNGSAFKQGNQPSSTNYAVTVNALVYLNGTTDYIELYGYTNNSRTVNAALNTTYFQASMARSA
jgi:hypothetical protein